MDKNKLPELADPRGAAEIDYSARESWRLFGIMAEFVAATERLSGIRPAVSIFGSARTWALLALYDFAYQYVSTLAGAFLLAAPFLATGLYALSRDRERGVRPRLLPSLTAWRENVGGLGVYVLVITVIFLVWARASLAFALFSAGTMPDLKGFLAKAFSLGNIEFALVYFAVGSVFATLVFAVSVVSVPMMLDRGNDAVSAAILSVQVLARNPGTMAVWAALIVVLTGIGFATAFVGLVLTRPR